MGGVGGVVAGERVDPVEPVGHGADRDVEPARCFGGDTSGSKERVQGVQEGVGPAAGSGERFQQGVYQVDQRGLVAAQDR